jgi:hypothetical protein
MIMQHARAARAVAIAAHGMTVRLLGINFVAAALALIVQRMVAV